MRIRPLLLLLLALILGAAGCNQHPPMAPVTGVVTYKGEPLTHGSIMFQPDAGPPGKSVIGSNGTFELWTFEDGDGALVGRHRVRVSCVDESTRGDAMAEELSTGKSLIPVWYESMQTSGLEFEVEAKPKGEVNHFEVVISDKPPKRTR